jgi:hypothetical protein
MTDIDTAYAGALAGEHAAIYGYGILGPHLTGTALALAQQSELAHRDLRDQLIEALSSPPAAESFYTLPFAVTTPATAVALAAAIEERCTALWRDVVVAADIATRPAQLTAFTAVALRAAAWRRAGGAVPGTEAFPGLHTAI